MSEQHPTAPTAWRIVAAPTGADLAAALALRVEVFVDEQGVPADLERDGLDPACEHVVVFDPGDGAAVAAGRMRLSADGIAKMQRIAVRADRRGLGLGRLVMRHLEARAAAQGAAVSRLASQASAVGFYERVGYRAWGEPFVEAGIDHRWMDLALEARG